MRRLAILCSCFGFLIGCGEATHIEVAEACKTQTTQEDCEMVGNNLLEFTAGMEKFECVWKEGSCIMQPKQTHP